MPLARLNALQDPGSSPLKIDVEGLKDPGGESFLFAQEPEQQRLGADMAELALTCFGLRESHSHPSTLGEPLKPRYTHLGNGSPQRVHHRGADLVRRDAASPRIRIATLSCCRTLTLADAINECSRHETWPSNVCATPSYVSMSVRY